MTGRSENGERAPRFKAKMKPRSHSLSSSSPKISQPMRRPRPIDFCPLATHLNLPPSVSHFIQQRQSRESIVVGMGAASLASSSPLPTAKTSAGIRPNTRVQVKATIGEYANKNERSLCVCCIFREESEGVMMKNTFTTTRRFTVPPLYNEIVVHYIQRCCPILPSPEP